MFRRRIGASVFGRSAAFPPPVGYRRFVPQPFAPAAVSSSAMPCAQLRFSSTSTPTTGGSSSSSSYPFATAGNPSPSASSSSPIHEWRMHWISDFIMQRFPLPRTSLTTATNADVSWISSVASTTSIGATAATTPVVTTVRNANGAGVYWHSTVRSVLPAEILGVLAHDDPVLDTVVVHCPRDPNGELSKASVTICKAHIRFWVSRLQEEQALLTARLREEQALLTARLTREAEMWALEARCITTLGELFDKRDGVKEVAPLLVHDLEGLVCLAQFLDSLASCSKRTADGSLKAVSLSSCPDRFPFAGNDRHELIDMVVRQFNKPPFVKEHNPIFAFVGSPRMGKSRLLNELAIKLESSSHKYKFVAVPITMNSRTPLKTNATFTLEMARREMIGRAIFSISQRFGLGFDGSVDDVLDLVPPSTDWQIVFQFLEAVIGQGPTDHTGDQQRVVRMVLLVDEYSELVARCPEVAERRKRVATVHSHNPVSEAS